MGIVANNVAEEPIDDVVEEDIVEEDTVNEGATDEENVESSETEEVQDVEESTEDEAAEEESEEDQPEGVVEEGAEVSAEEFAGLNFDFSDGPVTLEYGDNESIEVESEEELVEILKTGKDPRKALRAATERNTKANAIKSDAERRIAELEQKLAEAASQLTEAQNVANAPPPLPKAVDPGLLDATSSNYNPAEWQRQTTLANAEWSKAHIEYAQKVAQGTAQPASSPKSDVESAQEGVQRANDEFWNGIEQHNLSQDVTSEIAREVNSDARQETFMQNLNATNTPFNGFSTKIFLDNVAAEIMAKHGVGPTGTAADIEKRAKARVVRTIKKSQQGGVSKPSGQKGTPNKGGTTGSVFNLGSKDRGRALDKHGSQAVLTSILNE